VELFFTCLKAADQVCEHGQKDHQGIMRRGGGMKQKKLKRRQSVTRDDTNCKTNCKENTTHEGHVKRLSVSWKLQKERTSIGLVKSG